MKKHLLFAVLALVTVFASCKKKSDDPSPSSTPSYAVPTSYNFANADYSTELTRLSMFKSLENYLKQAIPVTNSSGTITTNGHAVDSTVISHMFTNTGSPFTDTIAWNSLTVSLADDDAAVTTVETFFGQYAAASITAYQTGAPAASPGVAGLALNASNKYILEAANGINYAQMIQKIQFGSLVINQVINRINDISDFDNTTLISGKTYTAQEHAWDEAFGYVGFPKVPVDSLVNSTYVKANKSKFYYVGNYSTQTDSTTDLQCTKTLATAFILGRAAISNKDYATRDEQAAIIKTTMRKFLGAAMLQEWTEYNAAVNAPSLNIANLNGVISEMIGMVYAMKYVPGKIISDAQIQDLLTRLNANGSIWNVTSGDINYVRDQVIAIYGVNLK